MAGMEVLEYYSSDNRKHWLDEIKKSDWGAGTYLYELLRDNKLKELCGSDTKVLLLTEGDNLVSFCTYAPQDDIPNTTLTPWVGFVYTFPQYRGHHCMGFLFDYANGLALADGHGYLYVSTLEIGLYEKYGFSFLQFMKDVHGDESRVYRKEVFPTSAH
ncbi:MAG: GNAT family N-acetyltransferase [Spirochaetales bacterium]|nr:GNAT family N-acetyltransferase [Spirochaetales bacterium]